MADSSNYQVPFKRRRQQSTDYNQRRQLLKSGKHRVVVRLSNNHTRVQIAGFERSGDVNQAQTISRELEEYGWDEHTGNLPTAYLTGFLAGMKTDVEEAVLDKGTRTLRKKGRLFAAVKGLQDAGVEIPADETVFPDDSRLRGEHIEEMRDSEITKTFEKVKKNIEGEF